jgi:hypothetical protein
MVSILEIVLHLIWMLIQSVDIYNGKSHLFWMVKMSLIINNSQKM